MTIVKIPNGPVVGEIVNREFITKRMEWKGHFFNMYQGFGISKAIVEHLKSRGDVLGVVFVYIQKKKTTKYRILLCDITEDRFQLYKHRNEEQFIIPINQMEAS